jgi:hypothetical protein
VDLRRKARKVAIVALTPLAKAAVWVDTQVREAQVRKAARRLADEWAALQKSPPGPFVFLEVDSDDDLKYYVNRGWELMYYTPAKPEEYVYETWNLQHDREKLQMRLSASS